ncbi:hypothetical protein EV646_11388 [Kribbella antiqua]|uniref:Uncharacterized protein n=1 Tax=Kribbella antiqua TaxID=2512217 RepID=A0A4R2IE57_9ACTN|nr:hypothetical protein [Kribbella antiqua]TCO42466.1 hypothetical protein EV646_11388 [Kribbella antiqua]
MTVGGVDTYYDYDEKQWKSRKLGGGPIRRGPVCPSPRTVSKEQHGASAGQGAITVVRTLPEASAERR